MSDHDRVTRLTSSKWATIAGNAMFVPVVAIGIAHIASIDTARPSRYAAVVTDGVASDARTDPWTDPSNEPGPAAEPDTGTDSTVGPPVGPQRRRSNTFAIAAGGAAARRTAPSATRQAT